MNKNMKDLNRITLALFLIGIMIFAISDGISKMAIAYVLVMALYFLFAEAFDYYLWRNSDSKKRELQQLINEMEEQRDDETGHDQLLS